MSEYYIKSGPEAEASGPYTVEALQELAKAGKITLDTLHYCDDETGWRPISSSQELPDKLFGSKPKLSLKQRPDSLPQKSENTPTPAAKNIFAEELPNGLHDPVVKKFLWQNRVASFAMPMMAIVNLFMGALLLWANYGKIAQLMPAHNIGSLLYVPGCVFGGLFLVAGVLLIFSVSAVYPMVRYAAFALISYFGILSWGYLYEGHGEGLFILLSGIGFGLGTYICTFTLNIFLFVISALAAILGIYSYIYFLFLL